MLGSASLFRDFKVYFALFCFVPWPKVGGAWHNTPTLNTSMDVHVLMVTAFKSQLETIQQVFLKDVVCEYCFFTKSFIYDKIYRYVSVGA